jgi:hypothetical protein
VSGPGFVNTESGIAIGGRHGKLADAGKLAWQPEVALLEREHQRLCDLASRTDPTAVLALVHPQIGKPKRLLGGRSVPRQERDAAGVGHGLLTGADGERLAGSGDDAVQALGLGADQNAELVAAQPVGGR